MKKIFFALSLFTLPLAARELLCEQCEVDQEPDCWEHLFVERSQVFVNAEFLYWQANEGNLDFAIPMNQTTLAPDTFGIGKYKRAEYDGKPGFRVALTYYRCPKLWEVTGQYTWFYDKGHNHVSSPTEADHFLTPTRQTLTSGPFESAESDISLHYQLGDLYVNYVKVPNPHLKIRLLAGVTAAFIEQNWKLNYTNTFGSFDEIKEKWQFSGGGLRTGIWADWYWCWQLYLTAKGTLAAYIGHYVNEEVQTNGADELLLGSAKYDDHRFVTNAQMLLGPSWQVPCDCWSFELFVGYEFNVWFNLQERIRTQFNDISSSKETYHATSLFGVSGLTMRLTVGF